MDELRIFVRSYWVTRDCAEMIHTDCVLNIPKLRSSSYEIIG